MASSIRSKSSELPLDLPEFEESDELSAPPKREVSIIAGLFRAQANKMRRYLAYRLQNAEDAKDATQDVFLKLWRHEQAGQLRPDAKAYMYSASHTVAIDTERHRNYHDRDRLPDADLEAVASDAHTQDERQYWRAAITHLVDNLEALPEFTRKVFVLHHFDGLDYAEIAAKLDVSRRTIERHIAVGTKEMRATMKDYL